MGLNTAPLTGIPGILRIITIIGGLVTLGLTATRYFNVPREQFFLAMVIMCLLVSLIWTVISILNLVTVTKLNKRIDIGLHFSSGLFLLLGAVLWLWSVVQSEPAMREVCRLAASRTPFPIQCPEFNQPQRAAAGLLGAGNGIVYLATGAALLFSKM